ncbi:hypothetical protein E2320_012622 [Naja naja]|nr:hypothetical protein E2320_012622 [Naja naja]
MEKGSLAQMCGMRSWTQPPSSSVSLGGTITLSCITQSSYPIGWHQQKGQALILSTVTAAAGEKGSQIGSLPPDLAVQDRWSSPMLRLKMRQIITVLAGTVQATRSTVVKFLWEYFFLFSLTLSSLLPPLIKGIDGQSSWTQPPSSSVSLGGTITISCITQSSYSIGWYQQKGGQGPRFVHCDGCSRGEGIPNRFTATRSGSTGSLVITNVEPEDEGDYYCGSWNSAGNQIHSGEFLWGSIDGQSSWTQPPSSSVSLGGTITISCITTQSSYEIGWYQQKGGQGPRFVHCDGCSRGEGIPDRFTATRSGSTGSLAITNAQVEDEGDYYCSSWNSAVTQIHSGIDGQSSWTQPPSSSVSLGGTVTLSCITQSSYSIGWNQQKAGQAPRFVHCEGCSRGEGIPDRFTATRSGSTGSLVITNVELEDEADYYCVSWNSAGNQIHSGIDGQSSWTQPPSSSVSLGGTITISCRTTQSSYSIGWYQQKGGQGPRFVHCDGCSRGEGIPDRFTATRSGSTGSLAITNAEPEDEADYYCGSWNSAGNQIHSGIDCQQSWIQPPSSSVSPAGTIRLSYTTQVDNTISWYQQKAGKGPRFVHCDGCGSSRGEEIPNRFTATRSGTTGTLTITNVEAEDEADYYCGRWNSAGNVLYSYGEGQQKPPLFLFSLEQEATYLDLTLGTLHLKMQERKDL